MTLSDLPNMEILYFYGSYGPPRSADRRPDIKSKMTHFHGTVLRWKESETTITHKTP